MNGPQQSDTGHRDKHRHVIADIPMRLATGTGMDATVEAELHYTTRDPYAVRATFCRANHAPVVWVFARDLLLVGTAHATGAGDVKVEPLGPDIIFTLSSPEGSAQLAASASEVRRFAAQMLSTVPIGDEDAFVDIDAELRALDPSLFTREDV